MPIVANSIFTRDRRINIFADFLTEFFRVFQHRGLLAAADVKDPIVGPRIVEDGPVSVNHIVYMHVIALLLSDSPDLDDAAVQSLLRRSQSIATAEGISVDACRALQLMVGSRNCSASSNQLALSELKPET